MMECLTCKILPIINITPPKTLKDISRGLDLHVCAWVGVGGRCVCVN